MSHQAWSRLGNIRQVQPSLRNATGEGKTSVTVESPGYWSCQGHGLTAKTEVGVKWSQPGVQTSRVRCRRRSWRSRATVTSQEPRRSWVSPRYWTQHFRIWIYTTGLWFCSLKKIYFYVYFLFMFMYSACMYFCIPHACLVANEASRGCRSSWHGTHRAKFSMAVLRTVPGAFARAANGLRLWAISPGPCFCF